METNPVISKAILIEAEIASKFPDNGCPIDLPTEQLRKEFILKYYNSKKETEKQLLINN